LQADNALTYGDAYNQRQSQTIKKGGQKDGKNGGQSREKSLGLWIV
jgi:hypothetical protein